MALAEPTPALLRFLALCRTSTDDQQSPEDSKAWQLGRIRPLVEPHGTIVEVVHDIAFSRSVPWMRRPEALALLERARLPAHLRGFDAIVVAEPQRAWGDSAQVIDILRKLDHFGIPMWTPEVGGPIDLHNEAHMMVMGMYGQMSESERRRIGIRVRNASVAHVQNGNRFWICARAPYGYKLELTDIPHPNPVKARDGMRLKRLVIDPPAAAVVREIFERYADGAGRRAIVMWLNDAGIPTPSKHVPYRVGRTQLSGVWAGTTVSDILRNPVYTGYLVYARERRRDRLVDVNNTTLGYRPSYTANPEDEWVWSPEPTHEAIVSSELWNAVQTMRKDNKAVWYERKARRAPHASKVPYVLRGVVRCAQCGHWMQGAEGRGNIYLRCNLSDYAAQQPECADHPKSIYLREDRVLPGLIDTVTRLLTDPDHAAATVAAMAKASRQRTGVDAIEAATRRRLSEAKAKMDQLRKTLEAGGDPTVIGQWITEAATEMRAAEAHLAEMNVHEKPLTDDQVRALIARVAPTFSDRLAKAADVAGPKLNRFLRDYGVRVDWWPGADTATVTVAPPDWRTGVGAAPAPVAPTSPAAASREVGTASNAGSPFNDGAARGAGIAGSSAGRRSWRCSASGPPSRWGRSPGGGPGPSRPRPASLRPSTSGTGEGAPPAPPAPARLPSAPAPHSPPQPPAAAHHCR